MDAEKFWQAVVRQDARQLKEYFAADAQIRWHNTNELFTADEFIRANCAYPGRWGGEDGCSTPRSPGLPAWDASPSGCWTTSASSTRRS